MIDLLISETASAVEQIRQINTHNELCIKHRDSITSLIKYLEATLDHPFRELIPIEKFALACLSKGIGIAKSSLLLISEGYPEEAATLIRSLIDLAIQCSWILKNEELQEFRLALYEHNTRHLDTRLHEKIIELSIDKSDLPENHLEILAEFQAIERASYESLEILATEHKDIKRDKYGKILLWHKIPKEQMCKETSTAYLYDVDFHLASSSVHSDANSTCRYFIEKNGSVYYDQLHNKEHLKVTFLTQSRLYSTLRYIGDLVNVFTDRIRLPLTHETIRVHEFLGKKYGEQFGRIIDSTLI